MAEDPRSSCERQVLSAPMRELLTWLAARSRTYGETMEAWKTSCPRMSIWEDASADGFIEVVPSGGEGPMSHAVRLSPLGKAALSDRH
jgi:hypothetical protein